MKPVEIFEKRIETEIHEPKLNLSLLKKRGNSKTFKGLLLSDMKTAKKDGNFEVLALIQHYYKKCCKFEKQKSKPLVEIEIVEGWKGIDNIEVFRGFTNDFVINSHQKDKETGEVTFATHQIPFERVNRLFFYIKQWKIGETHKCYDFAEIVGEKDWKEVWKKRTDVYFPLYYYPIKVLEALGMIKYSGRGNITRVR